VTIVAMSSGFGLSIALVFPALVVNPRLFSEMWPGLLAFRHGPQSPFDRGIDPLYQIRRGSLANQVFRRAWRNHFAPVSSKPRNNRSSIAVEGLPNAVCLALEVKGGHG